LPISEPPIVPSRDAADRSEELALIPGGQFLMGSNDFYPEERPVRAAIVLPFWIERHPVTNAEFARFVEKTHYVTRAERPVNPQDYPEASEEELAPGGLVFRQPDGPVPLNDISRWWSFVPGANWRQPTGPGSDLAGLDEHPVVQIGYEDAEAYAAWRGRRLPTEAEWEMAARGGLESAPYCWGREVAVDGHDMANTWQGEFPWQNLALDGFEGTSPVGAFAPNGFGLVDMAGNVWEWTADWWQVGVQSTSACCSRRTAAERGEWSAAPGERFGRKVIKGGSYLCAPSYCLRYRPSARQPEAIDTTTCHIGFRCVVSASPPSK
jgi:formylglycine-generating enzyme